ncbi:MAG: AI-2E family transporter [Clostridia bacterium]|nr:AI-2E family transporter [Clostridia bacterium]
MKFFKKVDARLVYSGLVIAFGAAVFFCAFNNLDSIKKFLKTILYYISPMTSGLVLAYLLRPFAKFMERVPLKKIKSEKARVHISSLSAVILLLVVIVFLVATLIPQIINSATTFASNINDYIASAKVFIADALSHVDFIEVDVDKVIGSSDEIFTAIVNWVTNNGDLFADLLKEASSQLVNFIIAVAMSVYALLDRRNLKRGLLKLERVVLGDAKTERVNTILNRGDTLMMVFLSSNLLDALLIGAANFVFLSIFKAPYVLLLSVFLGAFNFIPTFGPIISGVVASVVMLMVKPDLLLGFIIFTVVLQQIDGNVIKPLLFGDSTGLSPFWVLVSIVVGGRMFGVAGMLLGVPVFALLSSLYSEIVDKYDKRSEPAPAEAAAPAAEAPPISPEPPAPEPQKPAGAKKKFPHKSKKAKN